MARIEDQQALDSFVEKWFEADGSLVAAFHPFESPGEFEELLESHLRELIVRRLPEAEEAAARRAAIWRRGSPFRGLESFETEHAPVFFGRSKAVADVLQALRQQAAAGRPFVLVLGMSGGGKSSLVKAGVVPLLVERGVVEGVGLWRTATMIPSETAGDLCAGLAAALVCAEALPMLDAGGTSQEELAAVLRDSPAAAVPLIKSALARAASAVTSEAEDAPDSRLALVVDQMEEIFTLEGVDSAQRDDFMRALDALARSGRVWIVATLRSDFFPRCAEVEALEGLKQGAGQYDLAPPSAAEIGQMIRRPALAAGLRFERDAATDEGLDDALRDAAAGAEASLPLLEFALEELYKRRTDDGVLTFDAYRELGGVEGALAKRAEQVFSQLQPSAQETLPRVFRSLVQIDPARGLATSRRVDVEAVAGAASQRYQSAEIKVVAEGATYVRFDDGVSDGAGGLGLVDAFIDARLFVTALAGDGRAVVKVAHEALLGHWPRLASWLEKDRENLRMRARLAAAATRWEEGGRAPDFLAQSGQPLAEAREVKESFSAQLSAQELSFVDASLDKEQRRRVLKRSVVAALAALSLAAAITAVIATGAGRESERRRGQAEELIGFMLGDLRATLDSVGRLDAMGNTAGKVLEYLGSLDESEQTDADLARRAKALRQIGEVRFEQGELEQAGEVLEEAARLAENLVARNPDNRPWRADLANSHFWLGYVLFESGDLDGAFERFDTQRSIYQLLSEEEPGNPEWRLELELAYTNLAYVFEARRETDRALEIHRRRLAVVQELVASDPTHREWRLRLAITHGLVGGLLEDQGALRAALDHHQSDLKIAQSLVAEEPDNVRWLEQRANSLAHLAVTLSMLGEVEPALEHFRAQIDDRRKLVEIDPDNAGWRSRLAWGKRMAGLTLAALGRVEEALSELRSAVEILDSPGGGDADAVSADLALARWALARVLAEHGGGGDALIEARQAHAVLERLAVERPRSGDAQSQLSQSYALLARILAKSGALEASNAAWQSAVDAIAPLAQGSRDPLLLAPWAESLFGLGRLEEARSVVDELRAQGYRETRFARLCREYGLSLSD